MNIPQRHARLLRQHTARKAKAKLARVVAVWLAKERAKPLRKGPFAIAPNGQVYWIGD